MPRRSQLSTGYRALLSIHPCLLLSPLSYSKPAVHIFFTALFQVFLVAVFVFGLTLFTGTWFTLLYFTTSVIKYFTKSLKITQSH